MKVFYCRVSTVEQNEARQIKAAEEQGADKIFIDKASGKNTERKELNEMIAFVRDGDTVIVSEFSRIARDTKDLLNIVETLTAKGVDFISLKENIDTSTPQGKFMLTVFAAMAQLERETILERQKEGIAIAKAEGKYKGRKRLDIDESKFKEVCSRWRAGEITAVQAQKEMGFNNGTTFYRKVKEYQL